MNSLILFYSPGACSLAPHILLEETGEEYILDKRFVQKEETHTPEYLKINPKGRVPALQIGAELITELPAVPWYLTRNTHALRPKGAREETRALNGLTIYPAPCIRRVMDCCGAAIALPTIRRFTRKCKKRQQRISARATH
jgi:glutathione S-transferase